ncbi:hypothetical protein VB711_24220 [Cronbergia sp. UHCC 0137]|uniref:hypothetical protein n=1 Tax=Cronbergia sp. UHCC 0137 TaxID=3110239 RepID=UPI002B203882|nr:hypothetical protein [Cronbergia sp. UHCC 0137]MEA5620919.1 hypothetical protein [Cronbergia sp. UHCC 0137]
MIKHDDTIFEEVFTKISPEIADTFTNEQLEAIKTGFSTHRWVHHPSDLRISVPIPGLKLYLVILAGPERRNSQITRSEKSLNTFWTPSNILFFLMVFIILAISGLTTFSFVFSSSGILPKSFYPTSIPWIYKQSECEHTGRNWRNGKCWDNEHSPTF